MTIEVKDHVWLYTSDRYGNHTFVLDTAKEVVEHLMECFPDADLIERADTIIDDQGIVAEQVKTLWTVQELDDHWGVYYEEWGWLGKELTPDEKILFVWSDSLQAFQPYRYDQAWYCCYDDVYDVEDLGE